jgi:GNAT superfamily N-acetyltransferase
MIVQITEANLELLFEVSSLVDGPFDDENEVRRKIRKFTKRDTCRAFIFVEDGVPLGYVGCKFHEKPADLDYESQVDSFGHIAKIGVREDARGKGIGKQLLLAGEQWIRSVGLPGVWLDYIPTETRKRFYREYEVLAEYTETDKTYKRRIAVKKW